MKNKNISPRALLCAALFCIGSFVSADDGSDWMSRVNDDAYVSQLSIPGAHDAGTGHGFQGFLGLLGGDSYARTQDKTLTQLWESGIRAFDLRPCVDGSDLRINHGSIQTKLTLSEAFTTLCGLLDSHPTEMAIVVIRHETEGDDSNSTWNAKMQALLKAEPVASHAVAFMPQLKMSNARGKLLILSRDAYASTPTGGFITGWGFSTDINSQKNGKIAGRTSTVQATCYIQDFYDCTASGAKAQKQESIRTLMLFAAEQNASSRIWAINHTSGYSLTASLFGSTVSTSDGYRDNAATQHAAVLDFLADHSGPLGLVVMDFGGTDTSNGYQVKSLEMTKAIIENNFRTSDYAAAMNVVKSSKQYRIFTLLDGQKYCLTDEGTLTTDLTAAGKFTFRRVKGEEFGYGFKLMSTCFTNPDLNGGDVVLTPGHIRTNEQTSPRDTWEAQVFLMNADSLFAIRATNARGGDSGWALAAKTFWTVVQGGDGPEAAYSFERDYIWQIEEPDSETDGIGTIRQAHSGDILTSTFDLGGRRIKSPFDGSSSLRKGIYIINGKKVIL
ncbi:MAG: hypothetical protein IJ209_02450 [Bacteroidaceae bacterium]|nr:hypothetical protein [Bacteroidaceae bacterium]